MAVAALSTAGFSQYLAVTSNVGASQQAWQALQQSLAAGNLTAAQTAFNTYQQLNQNLTSSSSGTNSQFANDMTALGKAIGSGNVTSAQQAFTTVQGDLETEPSPAVQSAESAVAQTVNEVDELLGYSGTAGISATSTDPTTTILDSAYGLNTSSSATDPGVAMLEADYGTGASASSTSAAGTSTGAAASTPASAGNKGSAASVNVYA